MFIRLQDACRLPVYALRSANGTRTVVLDGETFEQIQELANEWHNGTLR